MDGQTACLVTCLLVCLTLIFNFAQFLVLICLLQVENAPESDRKDLLSELGLMKKLKPHPHVIKLIACVTESGKESVFKERVSRLGACASYNVNHSISLFIKQSEAC